MIQIHNNEYSFKSLDFAVIMCLEFKQSNVIGALWWVAFEHLRDHLGGNLLNNI